MAVKRTLFDTSVMQRDWTTLKADGFTQEVAGVVFTASNPPCCGVPLGGIGTGCIDFDARGVFGWSSIFNAYSHMIADVPDQRMPRKLPRVQPIFGLAVGKETFVLTTEAFVSGGKLPWCTAPLNAHATLSEPRQDDVQVMGIQGVKPVKEVFYFGHYPIADAEYVFESPVTVGVRAWSSFIPGNTALSNIPAAMFDISVRNTSDETVDCTFAMNFPGPDHQEAMGMYFQKRRIEEDATGLFVSSNGGVDYFLGIFGEEQVKTGTGLQASHDIAMGYGSGRFAKNDSWAKIGDSLPQDDHFLEVNGQKLCQDPSASVSASFQLAAGEVKTLECILSWYAPVLVSGLGGGNERENEYESDWRGNKWQGRQSHLYHMYAQRYNNSLDVMRRVFEDKATILKKILAWQGVLLANQDIPVWLRDSLLNILCLLTEDGYWFQPRFPVKDWAFPNGVFIQYESPRDCPHSSCIPNDWISTMHLAYFFPEHYLQLLRSYKALQRPTGEIPFAVGKVGDLPNITQPEYTWQMSLNSSCYIYMVDRLWTISAQDSIIHEFYESIKKCHEFVCTLASGEHGLLRIPDRGGSEWFEYSKFYGITSHVGALHLSQLLIVERMARLMEDVEYAERCRAMYEQNRQAYEQKLWKGTHYLTYVDEEQNRINDDVMAYQLDGFFTNRQAGIPETIYHPEHMEMALETIYKSNVKLGNGFGALNYARADGRHIGDEEDMYGKYSIFTQNTMVLAMTYMYAGQYERGMDIAYHTWRNLILKQGLGWDCTHIVHALDGRKMFGADYNQQSVIWSLPAAIMGKDVSAPCKPGGIVFEMLKAVRETEEDTHRDCR